VVTGEVTPIFSGLTTFFGQFARYSVSQTGTLVYSTGGGNGGALLPKQRLLIVGMDGVEEEVPIAPRAYRNIRWSPDGSSIAFAGLGPGEDTGETHIYVYNVDLRTAPRQLMFTGTQGWPVWSPDGRRLVFNSTPGLRSGEGGAGQTLGSTAGANLYAKSAFDDSEPELLVDRIDTQYPYSWPEDDVIVFTDGSGGSSDLLMADLKDSVSLSEYLNIEADLGAMRISPDGGRIAYGSSETGRFEIYVRSFPQARQQVIISENGGDRPRWSPAGDAIYYWKIGPGPDTLMRARVQEEPAFGVVSREVVLAAEYVPATWDIHPDGDRFVIAQDESRAVVEEGGGPVERFFVVVNWFEELMAALGEGR
jgi:Tol biopolymer transport system component